MEQDDLTSHTDDRRPRGGHDETGAIAGRRRALAVIGGAGLAGLAAVAAACSPGTGAPASGGSGGSGATSTTAAVGSGGSGGTSTTADGASCSEIPDETAGPYPGDGSNGAQVLTQDGVVRSDIRSSFGSSTTTVDGIPLTVHLDVSDTSNGCDPLQGAAVYLWHADPQGRYSMYSNGVRDENSLRGVQVTDADGRVTFTTVVPGCYDGRWPHIHFEVYPDVGSITSARNAMKTTQLAFPTAMLSTAYAASSLYPTSTSNLSRVSLEDDNVFGDDDGVHQVATMTGDPTSGYTATLAVPV
ncbi:dioxygenase family protein [Dermatobacter hominis]|uniref:dioxygenase family protein n=1 Tax=Dermatobacter hominis TaxID=2884263 RepID=UPI001D0F70E9|nr:hypothetical protein [Dermatobacter hominis]UDY34226.1 hypothetical protein LH044_12850 [Dermatobacter hominis]